MHRPDITLQQLARRPRQVLDHRPGDHFGARRQLALQTDQLFLEQRQGLGHTDQHPVEPPAWQPAGGNERHRIKGFAVAHQVFLQALGAQERVAAGRDLHPAGQAGRQRAEAVVEHQHAGRGIRLLLGQIAEQVLVGGVEGLQRIVMLLWLADQIELGEGAVEQGHGGGGSGSSMGGRQ